MRKIITLLLLSACLTAPAVSAMPEDDDYLADRGTGMHTSLFGSYVRDQELLFYAFWEYNKLSDFEYSPSELGYPDPNDYFGSGFETEYLIFFGYGFSDSFAMEFESALRAKAVLNKSPADPSALPAYIEESGLGDTEIQFRWRTRKETADSFERIWFLKTVFPLQDDNSLLGTSEWELEGGINLTKGYSWGTLMYKAAIGFNTGENQLELGEFAIEYVKRTSDRWLWVASIEGEQDEIQLIGEAQFSFGRNMVLKLNSGFGLTKKASDFAPEVGVMWSF